MSEMIGILTVVKCDNNGTDIQALAMQMILHRMGLHAEVIDYAAPKWANKKLIIISSFRDIVYLPTKIFMRLSHERFRRKYYQRSQKCYGTEEIASLPYDTVIVGSDQIWNLSITGGDLNFFLPSVSAKYRRLSYAVSLGKERIEEDETRYHLSDMLKRFDMISVREISAIKALDEIGITARHDLDPVLMIEGDIWKRMARSFRMKHRYVLLYLVEFNAQAFEYAKRYAQQHQCKVIHLTRSPRPIKGVVSKRFVSVEAWLGYMAGAELVITNSYHGLAMAVDMHTSFCLVSLKCNQQSNARMLDLLKVLSLSNRVFDPNKATYPSINWNYVAKRLQELRRISQENLNKVLMK